MLVEYGKISGQMVVYEFISPKEDDELEDRKPCKTGFSP